MLDEKLMYKLLITYLSSGMKCLRILCFFKELYIDFRDDMKALLSLKD